jgi:hypothetical protein
MYLIQYNHLNLCGTPFFNNSHHLLTRTCGHGSSATPSCQWCRAAHRRDHRRTKASASRRNMPSRTQTPSSWSDTCPPTHECLLLQATPTHRRTNTSIFSVVICTARPRRCTRMSLTQTASNRSLFMRRLTYNLDASRFVIGRHTPTSDDEHPPRPPPWPHAGS